MQFKKFIRADEISPIDITENLCLRFRSHLLDNLTGKTPSDYFGAFKRVINTATKEGYFKINPITDIRNKTNASRRLKEFLEANEYAALIKAPISNLEVRDAFIICCFTGLRWVDIKGLLWKDTSDDKITTRIIQKKTGKPVEITIHPVVKTILENKKAHIAAWQGVPLELVELKGRVFNLPTPDGANKVLKNWVAKTNIKKKLTWHSARLSFSILLQDANVDTATVALLLGHTTSRYVNETYKRFRPKDQSEHLDKLPKIDWDLRDLE